MFIPLSYLLHIPYDVQVLAERDSLPHPPPLLVKIAPDLSQEDKRDIAIVVTREKVSADIDCRAEMTIFCIHVGWC